MTNAVVDGNGTATPKREFTSQDFEMYMEMAGPYREKVLERGEILTPQEVGAITHILNRAEMLYTPRSLAQFGLYARIGGLIDLNAARQDAVVRNRNEKEYHDLSARLNLPLTIEERAAIYRRLDKICDILEPEHRLTQ
jgi:hypothetical protein